MQNAIEKIVIVGGGSAGWMAAAALSNALAVAKVEIVVIETNEIATIGVGEATIPPFRSFNAMAGLDELEFIRRTSATFKLGIEFEDWDQIGGRYFHPFGKFGVDVNGVDFHHLWLRSKVDGCAVELERFSPCALAAQQGRFSPHKLEKVDPNLSWGFAYHFDAALYAGYLKEVSVRRGVQHLDARVAGVKLDGVSGNIESLALSDGRVVTGELFIDCTGFSALLMSQSLKVGYEDWSDVLLCDKAIVAQTQREDETPLYTRSRALSSGWQWKIPLQSRTGNGYVFSGSFQTDDQALEEFLRQFDAPLISDPRVIKFSSGKRKKAWHKNCVAMGLASGFIEPLESTSLYLVQQSISRLLSLFPDKSFSSASINKYNELFDVEMHAIKDFITLHYIAGKRVDTEFWRFCRSLITSSRLNEKLNLYLSTGYVYQDSFDLFKVASWVAVLEGQGMHAQNFSPLANAIAPGGFEVLMTTLVKRVAESVDLMPDNTANMKLLAAGSFK